MMTVSRARLLARSLAGCTAIVALGACSDNSTGSGLSAADVAKGKDIFRFETFGDETFWTDTLRMHEVIEQAVDPTTALAVGLKVDTDSLPPEVVVRDPERRDQSHRSRDHRRAAQAERGGRREGHGAERERQGHARARGHHVRALPLDRRQLVRARASASGSTAGRIAISTWARSSRSRRRCRRARRRCTTRGGRGSTIRASTSTARMARR